MAGAIAALASLPLAVCALLAARTYARAAVRYRFLAIAFAIGAAFTPLAFLAAVFRPALASAAAASPSGRLMADAEGLAPLVGRAALAVAGVLLVAFFLDVARVLVVKRRAVRYGTAPVRRAGLRESEAVRTPTAIGYLHPAVVVPAGFRARVDAGEWDAVLAHECAHLARRDDWAKAAQSLLLRAGWWLPGLWVLGRALDLEREVASDEHAARMGGPRPYAACLLRLATDRRCGGIAPAFAGGRSHVAIRVERLLRPPTDAAPLGRGIAAGLFAAAALSVLAGAMVAVPRVAPRAVLPRAERRLFTNHNHVVRPRAMARQPQRAFPPVVARVVRLAPLHRLAVVQPVIRHARSSSPRPRVAALRPPGRTPSAVVGRIPARHLCAACFDPKNAARAGGGGLGGGTTGDEPVGADEAAGTETMLWIRSPGSVAYP